jgi:hypothetical protein
MGSNKGIDLDDPNRIFRYMTLAAIGLTGLATGRIRAE